MLKPGSDFIIEEVKRLQKKTNEEIMIIYGNHVVSGFPSMIVLKSLAIVIAKRNLKPIEMIISLKYQDSNNNEKLIQVSSL